MPLWRHCLGDEPAIIPLPEIQIFGGGAHAGRRTDVQDFMVVAPRAKTFAEALEVTAEVYRAAGAIMAERGLLQGVADEGGWWPAFSTNEEALETLMRAIERAGLVPGEDAAISLDVAASEFGQGGRYRLGLEKRELDRDAMAEMLSRLVRPLSDRVDRGPVRRRRRRGVRAIHRRGRRPHPGDRRRLSRHQRGSGARGGAPEKRQCGSDQGQSGGHGQRSQSGAATKRAAQASARSSRRVRARPRIHRSFIWRSAGAPAN